MNRRVSGRSILYHYLQKVVIPRDDEFARRSAGGARHASVFHRPPVEMEFQA